MILNDYKASANRFYPCMLLPTIVLLIEKWQVTASDQ